MSPLTRVDAIGGEQRLDGLRAILLEREQERRLGAALLVLPTIHLPAPAVDIDTLDG